MTPPDDQAAEIVTASPRAARNGRWQYGDPIHALLVALLDERELILLAYRAGGKIALTWTEGGPHVQIVTPMVKTVLRGGKQPAA